jgi:PAS domain S-box-containing protein
MKKDQYIQMEIAKATHSFVSLLLLFGGLAILLLGVLDYFSTPENFANFLMYRLIVVAIFVILNVGFKKLNRFPTAFVIAATVVVSAMIEVMILSYGGHQSPYYAGMIIVFVFLFGLLPISFRLSLVLASIIYLTYLIPLLILDRITNVRIFFNNNIFLLAAILGGLVWRYFNYKLLVQNFSLQYDLEEQKKHLEIYSLQLQSMVDDRTKELSKSNKWHQALFDNATDGIIVLDQNGIIVNANDRACAMHGFSKEALVGSHSGLLEVDEKRGEAADRFQRILKGESLVYETEHYKKDGTRISLEVSSKAIPIHDEVYIQTFQRDITEKKKIQEHLFQAQKMDSIGMLAGGIAHDFNNVLTAILGYTDLIRRDVGANEKVLGRLSVIENASRKAGTMVSQLLGFSRKSEIELVPFDINDVVRDTVKLLERVIDKRIVIRPALGERLPAIEGDMNKIEQVLMNFMVNARDAMPYGGIITVTSRAIDARPGEAGVPPYIPAGTYVVLSIADTGVGIPEEIQRKIFEPFFTTKERGKGTGLGLAMVYGVITEHKGFVTVQSKINQGTTFTVYLPVTAKAASMHRKQSVLSVRGHEMILLVDDDENVLNFIKEALEKNGYKVIATTNPMSAIDAFTKMHREISLVITDVVMPLIDGRELMKRIAEIDSQARFLTVSGYSRYSEKSDDVKPDFFLQKPFDADDLLAMVRKIIDTSKALHKR